MCKNDFSMRSVSEKHVKKNHGNRPDFECEKCKKEFGELRELKKHASL